VTDHIVILQPKWLLNILDGVKPVEFRAGRDRRAPHAGQVAPGDRLWLKASGGDVWGVAFAGAVVSGGPLTLVEVAELCDGHMATCLDGEWLDKVMTARHVTAVSLERVERIDATFPVTDIRGKRQDAWQVLDAEDTELVFSRYYATTTAREDTAA